MIAKGFSLLEVLVSLFILSLLLLGLNVMQLKALQSARSTYYFSVAAVQLNSMQERLQTLSNQSDVDVFQARWNEQNKRVLPQGRGVVSLDASHDVLTVFWGKHTQCERDVVGLSGCLRVVTKGQSYLN